MNEEYLASGFADVDHSGDSLFYSNCLSLLDSLPYFRWYKEESYRRLALSPGLSVLDAGCGLGDDVLRVADRVAPGGRVVGVDSSTALIEQARARAGNSVGTVDFRVADARSLPFADEAFDRVRIDRVLQHIADPPKVLSELFRVLKSGGLAVAYDNDWGAYSLSSRNREITRLVEDEWRYSFPSPWIGRHLRLFFIQAGFVEVSVHPSVSLMTDFETADQTYNIRKTVDRLVVTSRLTEEVGRDWIAELADQSHEGSFQCSLTAYLVCGKCPE